MGNTCKPEGQSQAFTIDDLVDLPLGGTKEMAKGCGPSIDGLHGGTGYDRLRQRGFTWPENGEFNWGGLGSDCSMCSDPANGYGCDNCTGSDTVGGKRGTVRRVAYLADPSRCCITGTKIIDGKTCDPQYREKKNATCDSPMLKYCDPSNWDKPECKSWVQASIVNNRTVANVPISNYCSLKNNFLRPECQEWCSLVRNNSSMKSACDQAVLSYCGSNSTDPLCTCMNPPTNVSSIENLMASSKACWYKPCQTLTNDNYMTSTMLDQKHNCASTACLIEAGDISISGKDNKVNFNNSCATNILKPEYNTATSTGSVPTDPIAPNPNTPIEGSVTDSTTPSEPAVNADMDNYNRNIIIGSVVLVVFCIILVIIIIVAKK